ncbi:hypothetical protein ACFC1T_19635 [Kitasatospora sp. NPDC056076]|uniref:hypothetical protein n=1 Tax=Kitasatospora sp. NPDC056076 TaxID=3345703 RepID=UPI0035E35588
MGRSGLVVGAVLLLAACSGGGGGGTAAPSATPTPYGSVLDQALAPINTGLGKAAAATTKPDLDSALGTVESNAGRAVRSLNAAGTPGEAEAARTELVNGLTALSAESSALRSDLVKRKLCTVGAAQARLGGGQGLSGVSAALAKLTAAGYRTALTVPEFPKPPAKPRTLENGTMVREGAKDGSGSVELNNDSPDDAVFTLAVNGKSVASVFAAKGRRTGIEGVEAGSYDFYLTTGVDWDSEAKQFTQDCDFIKYQDQYTFKPAGTKWKVDLGPGDGSQGYAKVQGQTVNSAPQP